MRINKMITEGKCFDQSLLTCAIRKSWGLRGETLNYKMVARDDF